MAQEFLVVLNRREPEGFGFSLLGKPGFPPVIYDIAENSPAAESGKVEAGDVILQVNETNVIRFNTKEVLKCLRLSKDPVSLKLKRDPAMKEQIRDFLSSLNQENEYRYSIDTSVLTKNGSNGNVNNINRHQTNGPDYELYSSKSGNLSSNNSLSRDTHPLQDVTSCRNFDNEQISYRQPKFEAYMMTGDRVLKLTKNQQVSILPKHQKKIDSLLQRYQNSRGSIRNRNKLNQSQNSNSVPSSPVDTGSPHGEVKSSSAGTSPIPLLMCPIDSNSTITSTVTTGTMTVDTLEYTNSPYMVQMSRSDDHIQFRKDVSVSTNSVHLDEDSTSSLNPLLDTKEDNDSHKIEDQRVLWTYNAPRAVLDNSMSTSDENVTSSRQSPTSVSSSVMSSQSNDRKRPQITHTMSSATSNSFDVSQLETLSSPDYNEECCEILNSPDINMEFTDPSDSDSTLLVSEPKIRRTNKCIGVGSSGSGSHNQMNVEHDQNHRIVIQVRGVDKDCDLLPLQQQNIDSNSSSNRNSSHYYNSSSSNSKVARRFRRYDNLIGEDDDDRHGEHRIDPKKIGYKALSECDDELLALAEGAVNLAKAVSPPHSGSSEDECSDVESLHSFHYSPKAVDYPSAIRLAKRLYHLDGFKKSDVSRHLSKNNDFSRAVADEFLKQFNFANETLDLALRKFLKQFSLSGETQERERVLVHFSKRYLECNPGSFISQDAVHTLTCAIMLLNTDLHGHLTTRKMTCNAFIVYLAGLNDGEDFPSDVLKRLYQGIKSSPLEWATDDPDDINENGDGTLQGGYDERNNYINDGIKRDHAASHEPFHKSSMDYKKGYVMRKCCMEPNGKKTPLGKRGWKMFYCTLRDLVLYSHKDEHGFRKSEVCDNAHNAIRLHHALATKASDYTKKLHVFRLETAERAEYLFQTSDSKELQSWVDTINLVCASFSAPALPAPVGSQKKFQRPLLPSTLSKRTLREQLKEHAKAVERFENELEFHRNHAPERNCKTLVLHNYKEKDSFLCYELKRYKTYVYLLESRLPQMDHPKSISPIPLADIDSEEEGANAEEDATTTVSTIEGIPSVINRISGKCSDDEIIQLNLGHTENSLSLRKVISDQERKIQRRSNL